MRQRERKRETDTETEKERKRERQEKAVSILYQVFLEVEPESRIPVQVVYQGNARKTRKGVGKAGLGWGNSGLGINSGEAPDST